jgi:hypothetical protein
MAAVISVIETTGVILEGLSIDASDNSVSGCDVMLAGIRFLNSSGEVLRSAITGTQLKQPRSCPNLFPGNGFGIVADASLAGTFSVSITGNSVHDFSRNGILVRGAGLNADIVDNVVSGRGPAYGFFQFGVFAADGAVARITGNTLVQANCGSLSHDRCLDVRSEGVVLRSVGAGTVVDNNTITNVQSGIFVNGGENLKIRNNLISNVDVLSGIHVQRMTDSLVAQNRVVRVGPINNEASNNQEGCGINAVSGAANSRNTYVDNFVNDAYCGVAYVSSDLVLAGTYVNTLYTTFNSDLYPRAYPPVSGAIQ